MASTHKQLFFDSCKPPFPHQEWAVKPTGLAKAYLRLVFKSFKKIAKETRKDIKKCGRVFVPTPKMIKRNPIKKQKAEGVADPRVLVVGKQERRTGLMTYAPESKKKTLVTPITMMTTAEMMKAAGVSALPTWDDRPD